MNTLGYVARQFDVLAAAKTPSSSEKPLPRVSTWSSKSFLFPHASPKRSHSSPSLQQSSSAPSIPQLDAVTGTPTLPRSKHHLESVIDRIFFIRVFLMVWDHLKAAWSSIVEHVSLLTWRNAIAIDKLSSTRDKGKSKEIEPDLIHSALNLDIIRSTSNSGFTPLIARRDSSPLSQTQTNSPASTSRSATPVLNAKKAPFHLVPKTLVLDLDETLIHSTSRPIPWQGSSGSGLLSLGSFGQRNKGHMVEVVMGGRSTLYHVYKRPFVDFFLRTVSGWYTLVIFTASMQEYADPVIDWLDAGRGILPHRLFRDSCTQLPNGSYTKDLSLVEADLSRVCLVDNSPVSYTVNEANGIPIEGWTHDPSDEALLDLLPVLDSLRFTSDVRRVLGLRSAGVSHTY